VGSRVLVGALAMVLLASARASFIWSKGSDGTRIASLSPEAAQALRSKLQILSGQDVKAANSNRPIIITETEANSYLKYHARDFFPPGVTDPTIRITPDRVIGAANVDFGEFSRADSNPNDWGPKVLAAMFKGTQRFVAAGKVHSQNGQANVRIESVAIGATRVPDWLVDFVVENYLQPRYKFDLSKPIPLPDHVTHIELGSGRATFFRSPQKNP
jgi:hypothetical protein